jgi:hypothetical protein
VKDGIASEQDFGGVTPESVVNDYSGCASLPCCREQSRHQGEAECLTAVLGSDERVPSKENRGAVHGLIGEYGINKAYDVAIFNSNNADECG